MSQKQQTMKKLAKAAYIITKVFRIVIYVAIGVMLASLVFMLAAGTEQSIEIGSTGAVTVYSGITADIDMGREATILVLSSSIVYAFIITVTLHYLGAVFKSTGNEGSPFDPENVKLLKKAAISIVLLSVIPIIVEVAVAVTLGTLRFNSMQVDVIYIALAFFFFCLAYIFEYGAELQKQSDETL